eukprot:3905593-Karenia_brevis.AAC.1
MARDHPQGSPRRSARCGEFSCLALGLGWRFGLCIGQLMTTGVRLDWQQHWSADDDFHTIGLAALGSPPKSDL